MSTATTIAVPETVLRRLRQRIYTESDRCEELEDEDERDDALFLSKGYTVLVVEFILSLLLDEEEPGLPNDVWDFPDFPPDLVDDMRITRAEIRALREP